MSADLAALVSRLEAVTAKLEAHAGGASPAAATAGGSGASAGGDAGSSAAFVSAYGDLVTEHIAPLVELSNKIGGDVAQLGGLLKAAIDAQAALLTVAAASKKPADSDLPPILGPLSEAIGAVVKFRDDNRASKESNFLFAAAESIPALGWVAVAPAPGPFVKEMGSAAQFYTNKILREFKGKDETRVSWVKAYSGFFGALVPYIKQYHTTGLAWNPKGGAAKAPAAAPAAPSGGGPAAPPPPKPLTAAEISGGSAASSSASGKPNTGALFAELNKGGAITSGLRKVTRDMTNKDKKVSGVVKQPTAAQKRAAAAKANRKPPVFELAGLKWKVEHQYDNQSVVIEGAQRNQSAYIFNCENSVIQVKGKINSICLDKCKKVGLVFEDAVATVELVNCSSVKVQVTGSSPAFAVDKSQGVIIYLSRASIGSEIITSTSSEMNIVFPGATDDADPIELPIPEQFKTIIKDGKLETNHVDHSGG